jgi:DNA-binding response OmpR family regulator
MLPMMACDLVAASSEQRGGGTGPSFVADERRAARVLVVDDHVDTADVMQMFLAHAGYEVVPAYSGEEALSLASQFTPDLAILDIRLPDMDGYDLALSLRTGCAHGLRLIGLTGCASPDFALATRFDEIARKPIRGGELLRILRRFRPR